MHTSNIIWTQQVMVSNMSVYTNTYMHAITINEKEVMTLKERREECMGGFEEKEREGINVIKLGYQKINVNYVCCYSGRIRGTIIRPTTRGFAFYLTGCQESLQWEGKQNNPDDIKVMISL